MPATRTSWPKGRSGNPRGRPRCGEELATLLRQTVDHKRFAKKLCALCYAGDVQAMRLLLSYTDGLPIARGELQSPEGIQITVTYVQQNNRIDFTGATPGATEDHPGVSAVQRLVLRAPLGQDTAGDGSPDSRGTAG
jgi:hypothetical protein